MFPPTTSTSSDASIRSTDNDAALARLSATNKGYINDPFVKYLVPRAHLQPPRPPLINIGTYVRTKAIDALVDQWLGLSGKASKKCQIVSLGAGSDTRFWRIASSKLNDHLSTYIEFDFPEITTKKAMSIKKNRDLIGHLGDAPHVSLAQGGSALHSPRYHLLPLDIRLDPSEALQAALRLSPSSNGHSSSPHGQHILDPSLPTLLIFECVLAYIEPEISSRLLEWFVQWRRTGAGAGVPLGCIIYEMFGLDDTFGRVMISNLKERDITLPGALPYTTIQHLKSRLLSAGFTSSDALSLKQIRKEYTPSEELERISTLELLDETEELDLVLAHYAMSWGISISERQATEVKGASESESVWEGWGLVKPNAREDEDS